MFPVNHAISELPIFSLFGDLLDSAVRIVVVIEETYARGRFDVILIGEYFDVFSNHFPNYLFCLLIVEIIIHKNGPDKSLENVTQQLYLAHLDSL